MVVQSLQAVVDVLSTTRALDEFTGAVRELDHFKREFNWRQPHGVEFESISKADRLVFQRTHANAKVFLLRGRLLGILQLCVVLALFPLLVASALSIMAKVLGFHSPLLAFQAAFLGVYSAAMVHELSHWLAMSGSCRPFAIYGELPFAAVRLEIRCKRKRLSGAEMLLLYGGGSVGNILFALFLAIMIFEAGASISIVTISVILANIGVGLANLIPVTTWSTDGAKIMRILRGCRERG